MKSVRSASMENSDSSTTDSATSIDVPAGAPVATTVGVTLLPGSAEARPKSTFTSSATSLPAMRTARCCCRNWVSSKRAAVSQALGAMSARRGSSTKRARPFSSTTRTSCTASLSSDSSTWPPGLGAATSTRRLSPAFSGAVSVSSWKPRPGGGIGFVSLVSQKSDWASTRSCGLVPSSTSTRAMPRASASSTTRPVPSFTFVRASAMRVALPSSDRRIRRTTTSGLVARPLASSLRRSTVTFSPGRYRKREVRTSTKYGSFDTLMVPLPWISRREASVTKTCTPYCTDS